MMIIITHSCMPLATSSMMPTIIAMPTTEKNVSFFTAIFLSVSTLGCEVVVAGGVRVSVGFGIEVDLVEDMVNFVVGGLPVDVVDGTVEEVVGGVVGVVSGEVAAVVEVSHGTLS